MRKTPFEVEPCSRCGGTGRYSYCQMYGDRCFGCGGSGSRLTKRGAAARAFFYESLPRKRAGDLVAGDRVRVWNDAARVVKSTKQRETGFEVVVGGRFTSPLGDSFSECGHQLASADEIVVVVPPEPERVALVKAALEYQVTLTKQGKPRKRQRGEACNAHDAKQ